MKVIKTEFEGLLILEPTVRKDSRGYFFEAYNKKMFEAAGLDADFIQDNQSHSSRGVLRGLHYQIPPFAQTKLIRVLHGVIQDVVVDLRKAQATYGKSYSIDLSADEQRQLWVPIGFAHGFLVLSEFAEVLYKCDQFYHPEAERSIHYKDSQLSISWEMTGSSLIISDKDQRNPLFSETKSAF